MKKAHYHQRQDRLFYPNYPGTITTNKSRFYGLLIAGFFVFMIAFGGSVFAIDTHPEASNMMEMFQTFAIQDDKMTIHP